MTRSGTLCGLAITVIGAAIAGVAAAPAYADDLSSGTWYFDKGHVQEALDAGFAGKGVKIAVIDSPINTSIPTLRNANLTVVDKSYCFDAQGKPIPARSTDYAVSFHGTQVASMIAGTGETDPGELPIRGVAPGAKVLYYAGNGAQVGPGGETSCRDEKGMESGTVGGGKAMNDAIDAGVDIISVSWAGSSSTELTRALARAQALGIPVIAGLPNDPVASLDNPGFPGTANGTVAVQAIDASGAVQTSGGFPNIDPHVKIAAPGVGILLPGTKNSWNQQEIGSGTSLATPIVAGFLADMKSKFPTATGNQLLQTMIRNTGGTHHESEWGKDLGYGTISLTQMRADNPLAYEDVNPFFDPKATEPELPTAEDVRAAKSAEALKPTPGDRTASPQSGKPVAATVDAGPPAWLVIGGAVLAVLFVGGIVLAVVSARRSKAADSADGGPSPADGDHFMHAPTGAGTGADQGGTR